MLADGRRFRTRNVLDTVTAVTRACLALEVDTALPGRWVVPLLEQRICWHGVPKQFPLDNGPKFTGQARDAWAYQHGVTLDCSDPGRPMQNSYPERFDGKCRDTCRNVRWFRSLATACQITENRRQAYNTERPHSALGERTLTQQMVDNQQAASLA